MPRHFVDNILHLIFRYALMHYALGANSLTPVITIMHTTIHGVIAIYFAARILRICMASTKRYNDILLITIFD